MADTAQAGVDAKNAAFWNELCGTGLARNLGIESATPENLKRFDAAYHEFYPYLAGYVTREPLAGKRVLEIGLGWGTLSQLLAEQGCEYHGLDVAPNAAAMVNFRLSLLNKPQSARVGSVLEMPFEPASFDYVYTIGCLHHTGDLPRAVDAVYEALRPGGSAVVMLYNRNSYRRRVEIPLKELRERVRNGAEAVRAMYDSNADGEAAPHTDFTSRAGVRTLFRRFASRRVDVHNFDGLTLPVLGVAIPRRLLLSNIARCVGLDLYIVARK
jgi:SAM-dependent methyltransferase